MLEKDEHTVSLAYPNVQLRPFVLFPLEHFGGSVGRAATPRRQWFPGVVEVSKAKVLKSEGRDKTALIS